MKLKNKISQFFNSFIKTTKSSFQLVTENGNGFYSWNGDVYESDIVRSCIRPFSKAIGKLSAQHIRGVAEKLKVNPEPYIRFLLEEPNPLMSGQTLQEKLATQLKLNNNAFACILRDEFGFATEIYPLPAVNVEALYNDDKVLFLKFNLINGKTVIFAYSDVIHLRQDFNRNDIFGDSPIAALQPLMEIVNTTDQGIVKAIKNSGIVKWLIKLKGQYHTDDINEYVGNFNRTFLDVENGLGGAAAIDNKADIEQVDPKDYVPNASQMEKTIQRLYNFYGTNEKIIQSKYSEDEWNAYYESEIEPIAIQLGMEFTRKIFSRRERGCDNKILFASATLQNASMSSKLNLLQMVDRGAMTPNEWREVLNLAPIEGGSLPIRRLDTAVVTKTEGTNKNEKQTTK